ncbi:hypothetical protein FRB90_001003 [Tulasnella sp. 427]|nr:hypothetical protein FRB90_001003 [Tulasnella sp. 427]
MASNELVMGSERAIALQASVQKELAVKGYSPEDDTVMAEYITIMLINDKTPDQVTSELTELIPDYDPVFTDWLFEEKRNPNLVSEPEPSSQAPEEPPSGNNGSLTSNGTASRQPGLVVLEVTFNVIILTPLVSTGEVLLALYTSRRSHLCRAKMLRADRLEVRNDNGHHRPQALDPQRRDEPIFRTGRERCAMTPQIVDLLLDIVLVASSTESALGKINLAGLMTVTYITNSR